jgi:hypothetical protein
MDIGMGYEEISEECGEFSMKGNLVFGNEGQSYGGRKTDNPTFLRLPNKKETEFLPWKTRFRFL